MKKLTVRIAACLLACACILSSSALADYGTEPTVAAKGEVLYEKTSDTILFSQGADERLYPASCTKIMTALLLLEYGDLDRTVTASQTAISTVPQGSSLAGLKTGEELTLDELLICLLVPSGNDAANVIAESIGGTIEHFVEMMNEKAEELGCENTHFANAHGFHNENHYTSAADLLKITLAAMEYPRFTEVCGMSRATIDATNICPERNFNNTNYMISNTETSAYLYAYCLGGKTGSTTEAGNCLVAFAQKGDLYLVSVMLGSKTEYTYSGVRRILSFLDTEDLFDWGFSHFSYRTIVPVSEPAAEVKVALSEEQDYVVLNPERELRVLLYKTVSDDEFTTKIELEQDVTAPVLRGDVLGTMKVYRKGKLIDTIQLLAAEDVERSQTLYMLAEIRRTLKEPWFGWLIAALIAVIVIYIIVMIEHNRRLRKKLNRRRRHTNIRH